jgi:hypothetical protein
MSDAPNSFDEFRIAYKGSRGRSLDSKHGLTIASRPTNNGTIYINIIRRKDRSKTDTYELTNFRGDENIEVVPRTDMINRGLVAGSSGSGKSTFCAKWIDAFQEQQDDPYDVFVISRVDEDEPLDELEKVQRLDLDEIAEDPPVAEDFEESIVIFDDNDTITDKETKRAVLDLKDDIFQTGRHSSIETLIVVHQIFLGSDSKKNLSEMSFCVVFPRSGNSYHLRRLFQLYFGLNSKQFKKILSHNSRYIYVQRSYPSYVITEKDVYLI